MYFSAIERGWGRQSGDEDPKPHFFMRNEETIIWIGDKSCSYA